jgi:uncharacterized protein (TIGR00251 family)
MSLAGPLPFTIDAKGVTLCVRATPNASRSAIAGIVEIAGGRSALSIRLAAPPVDGAANTALIAFLAKALDVRKADVTIASGQSARIKIVRIGGEPARLTSVLEGMLQRE